MLAFCTVALVVQAQGTVVGAAGHGSAGGEMPGGRSAAGAIQPADTLDGTQAGNTAPLRLTTILPTLSTNEGRFKGFRGRSHKS